MQNNFPNETEQRKKRVYILPNLFTTANLFLGMLAIIEISQHTTATPDDPSHLLRACWFIIGAAVMDMLDGKVARLMRAQSEFGVQYDSLADLVSFGAAPAFLIYISFLRDIKNQQIAALATVLFVITGALRLARFNIQRQKEEKKSFTGLPIPAAACMVISTYLLLRKHEFVILIKGVPWIMLLVSGLMVSEIAYPSLKSIPIRRARSFRTFITLVIGGVLFYGLRDLREAFIFGIFAGYLLYGIVVEVFQVVTGRKPDIQRALEESALIEDEELTDDSGGRKIQAEESQNS